MSNTDKGWYPECEEHRSTLWVDLRGIGSPVSLSRSTSWKDEKGKATTIGLLLMLILKHNILYSGMNESSHTVPVRTVHLPPSDPDLPATFPFLSTSTLLTTSTFIFHVFGYHYRSIGLVLHEFACLSTSKTFWFNSPKRCAEEILEDGQRGEFKETITFPFYVQIPR